MASNQCLEMETEKLLFEERLAAAHEKAHDDDHAMQHLQVKLNEEAAQFERINEMHASYRQQAEYFYNEESHAASFVQVLAHEELRVREMAGQLQGSLMQSHEVIERQRAELAVLTEKNKSREDSVIRAAMAFTAQGAQHQAEVLELRKLLEIQQAEFDKEHAKSGRAERQNNEI